MSNIGAFYTAGLLSEPKAKRTKKSVAKTVVKKTVTKKVVKPSVSAVSPEESKVLAYLKENYASFEWSIAEGTGLAAPVVTKTLKSLAAKKKVYELEAKCWDLVGR
jgi:hypothetical protein